LLIQYNAFNVDNHYEIKGQSEVMLTPLLNLKLAFGIFT